MVFCKLLQTAPRAQRIFSGILPEQLHVERFQFAIERSFRNRARSWEVARPSCSSSIFASTAIASSTALEVSSSSRSKNGVRGIPSRKPEAGCFIAADVIFLRMLHAGDVQLVVSGQHVQQHRRVLHSSCHRTAMIQRIKHWNNSADRYESIGRFQSHDAAKRGRHAHRAARIRSQRAKRQSRKSPRRPTLPKILPKCNPAPTDFAPDRNSSSPKYLPSRIRADWSCR